ncbi:MAG: hypothetical protein H0U64_11320 [Gemmatimonadaceae bacterium]|nr:hypothetical protein [Gemmatimonadaceae bacterium]
MNWHKLGRVFAPDGTKWWAREYATLPTVLPLGGNMVRVYYASLDNDKVGRIGFVELDIRTPDKILFESAEPCLNVGTDGTFDDCGVNPSCIIERDGNFWMYYVGWQRCERVPYMIFAGLARSADGRVFERIQQTPILERTPAEPFLRSATSILPDGNGFRMWYVSAASWILVDGVQYPEYAIRTATSLDGVNWSEGQLCFSHEGGQEYGFGRPWVIRDDDRFRMWYSIRSRGAPYRIGYAESGDGLKWTRKDSEAGIETSDSGWDSEMICYSCVVDVNGGRYMFYNGNRHGQSGFGLAALAK